MQRSKRGRPTVGVLAGWQMYGSATPHSFLDSILRGIHSAALDRDCNLLLACGTATIGPLTTRPAWPIPSPGVDFLPVGPWNTDGLLVVNPLLSETRSRYVHSLLAKGFPIVFIGTAQGGPAVGIDNEGGIRQAMVHLIAHGHRRVAFVAGQPVDAPGDSGDRLKAYRETAQEFGLAADPALIAHGDHLFEGGQRAMQQILDSGVEFTAVLASNDESALGALRILKGAGLRVPQDVALIGFDDRPEAIFEIPPLTTIHPPTFERGYQALELLLDYVAGSRSIEDAGIVRVATRLTIRQSCGCRPGDAIPSPSVALAHPAPATASSSLTGELVRQMAASVLAETRRLHSDHVLTLCRHVASAFTSSLAQDDATDFLTSLKETLLQMEMEEDDAYVWQSAISALKDSIPALLAAGSCLMTQQRAEDMLDRAQVAVGRSLQRQYWRRAVGQVSTAERVGLLASHLLGARDEGEILDALAECLPQLGIQQTIIAFYEAERDDAVAWSIVHQVPSSTGTAIRLRSRQFPPEQLFPAACFHLALLPLKIQDELLGFMAFDAARLELYAPIVRQLAAALRSTRLYREANEGRRLAEEANRLKSRFLSTVSHELRTPLSLIVGLSEILLRRKDAGGCSLPQPYHEDIERIHASAQHLDGLIRDVLDLAQSDVGQLKLVCEPLDLAEVVRVAAMVGEQLARDKGLIWRQEIPDNLPNVWGDRTRLRQVTLNLISNAVKFTARGEVTLRVQARGGAVAVSVTDTGLGIPVAEQVAVFDEFRQSERTAARGYGGLGLGLAICKRLVQMHGGEIGVRSSGEEGAGSTFYFTLPTMAKATPPRGKETPEMRRRTLLLSASPSGDGQYLCEHLSRRGLDAGALWVNETTDWLAQLLASPPGAVVLDKGMASKQGWEILQVLKENPATQEIPVLVCSLAQEQGSGSSLALDYLSKPVGSAELARALARRGLTDQEGQEKTILVVDDEPGILEMHARVVQAQSTHYRVLKAQDGREALRVIRREQPDLVLLDLMMPELDGFGVLEAMQEEETIRNIPVIVLTAQVLTGADMARLNRGVATVLSKGLFSVKETLAHIEAALSHNRNLGSEAQRLVRKAMAYVHEHYADCLSREEIARYVGISKGYLSRCFRDEIGVSPMGYLNRYRVNRAKVLLTGDGRTIAEIAMAVGFSDSSYFSRVFRREVGMSPSEYLLEIGNRGTRKSHPST